MDKIIVIALVVDTTELTLYKTDGKTIKIKQGDPRLAPLVEKLKEPLSKNIPTEIEWETSNEGAIYKDFEEKSGGLVKLFRVAKRYIQHLITDPEPIAPMRAGQIPRPKPPEAMKPAPAIPAPPAVVAPTPIASEPTKMDRALSDIMANAEPVSAKDYDHDKTDETHTMVAIVKDTQGKDQAIPGVENLVSQFENSNKLNSTKGVENFLKRLTPVINSRGHSVRDVMNFMQKGDLPIAEDGCIVAYKVLKSTSEAGTYVDCHTKNVRQKVGSYVFMKPSMVDHNRNRECSNGLHIARRGYLGSFGGDIIVICKIKPEDVIAVPHNDPNKVRTCGYHILGLIPSNEHATLRSNKPMTENTAAAKLLGAVLKGDHIGVIENVEIGGLKGSDVHITSLVKGVAEHKTAISESKKLTKKAEPAKALPDKVEHKLDAPVLDPNKIAGSVTETKKAVAGLSRNEKARKFFTNKDYAAIISMKKAAKVTYEKLGFTEAEEKKILGTAVSPKAAKKLTAKEISEPKKKATPAVKLKPAKAPVEKMSPLQESIEAKLKAEPIQKDDGPVKIISDKGVHPKNLDKAVAEQTKTPAKKTVTKGKKTVTETPPLETLTEQPKKIVEADMSREEKARHYFDTRQWTQLWLLKKQAKKSFIQLGFTKKEEERANTNKPDHV